MLDTKTFNFSFKTAIYLDESKFKPLTKDLTNVLNLSSKSQKSLKKFKKDILSDETKNYFLSQYLEYEYTDIQKLQYYKKEFHKTDAKTLIDNDKFIHNAYLKYIENETRNFYSELKVKDIEKFNKLYPLFNLLFNLTRNFVPNIQNYYNVLKLRYEEDFKTTDYNQVLKCLYSSSIEDYNRFKKYSSWVKFNKNNINFAESYYNLFLETLNISYLDMSIQLLQSICRFGFGFNDKQTGLNLAIGDLKKQVNYYSRNKFCAYSSHIKSLKLKLDLISNLDYYKRLNYDFGFLTLSGKNLNITKNQITGLNDSLYKVNKEFWRTKINYDHFANYEKGYCDLNLYRENKHHLGKKISDIYPGYFGVMELKETSNPEIFNVHIHNIVLRHKTKHKGFIDLRLLSNAFKECSNKFGSSEMVNSFAVNIQKVNLYEDKKEIGAIRYILSYLSKGIDTKTNEGRLNLINHTKGLNLIRSGGLLNVSKLKTIHILESTSKEIERCNNIIKEFPDIDSSVLNLSFNSKTKDRFREDNSYKIPYQKEWFSLTPHYVADSLLFAYDLIYGHNNTMKNKYRVEVLVLKSWRKGLENGDKTFMKKSDAEKYEKEGLVKILDKPKLVETPKEQVKLKTIKFIKDTETKRIGDVAHTSKKSAEFLISKGYAILVEKTRINSKDNVIKTKQQGSKEYIKHNTKPKTIMTKTKHFENIKTSLYGNSCFYNPIELIFFDSKDKLTFSGVRNNFKSSWWSNPLFLLEYFENKEQFVLSEKLSHCFKLPNNLNYMLHDKHLFDDLKSYESDSGFFNMQELL